MSKHAEGLLQQALVLSPKGRAILVERLLASLDQPDPSEEQIDAYDAGELDSIPAEAVFKKYKKF
jgi:hypothetical protein